MKKILLIVAVFLLISGVTFGVNISKNAEMNGKFEVGIVPETQVIDAELKMDVVLKGRLLEHVFSVEAGGSVEEGSSQIGKYEFGYLIDYDHLFIGTGIVIYPEDSQVKVRAGIRW